MRDASQSIKLADYTPPAFLISTVDLQVDIAEGAATVRATLKLTRNPAHPKANAPLVLDGRDLELLGVSIDGRALAPAAWLGGAVARRRGGRGAPPGPPATGPAGKIRFPSPRISSRWSPRSSTCSRTTSPRARARRRCCRFTSSRESSTRPASRCRR